MGVRERILPLFSSVEEQMIIAVRDPRLGRKEKDDTSRKVETVVGKEEELLPPSRLHLPLHYIILTLLIII